MGANIPLPALATSTNAPNPLDEYMRAVQLRGAQQEQQLRAGQLEQQQMELEDQRNIRTLAPQFATKDENGKITGFDTEGYYNGLLNAGVNPQKITAMRSQQIELQKNLALADSATLKNVQDRHDQMYQMVEQVRRIAHDPKSTPEQIQSTYQQLVPRIRQLGGDISQFPAQYPGDEGLDHFEAGLAVFKQIQENAKNTAQINKDVAQTGESQQKTALDKIDAELKGNEAAWYKQNGIPPNIPLDKAEAAKYLTDHPGKDLVDFMRYKSTLVPAFRLAVETGPAAPPLPANATPQQVQDRVATVARKYNMTPGAFDQTAEKYYQTGTLPPVGRGLTGIGLQRELMNRAAELHPGESLAASSAAFKSNQASMENLQKQFDGVTAFENTAEKNMDRMLEVGKNIPDLGVRFADVPLRMIDAKMIGDQNISKFRTDLAVSQSEAAKVLNNPNGSGVLSDSSRHELQELIDGNLPYRSLQGVVEELKRDMGNRKQSYSEQIQDIRKRMGPSATPTPQGGGTNTSTTETGDFFSKFGGRAKKKPETNQ